MAIVRKAVVENGFTVDVILYDTANPVQPQAGQTFVDEAVAPSRRPDSGEVVAQRDLHGKARLALTGNTTFLGVANPSNAQNAAQLKALTRQVNAMIRLVVAGDLLGDNTDT